MIFLSDLHFLEEGIRIAESAERENKKFHNSKKRKRHDQDIPFYLRELQKAAAERAIRFEFMSAGMSRRTRNRTFYHRKKQVSIHVV